MVRLTKDQRLAAKTAQAKDKEVRRLARIEKAGRSRIEKGPVSLAALLTLPAGIPAKPVRKARAPRPDPLMVEEPAVVTMERADARAAKKAAKASPTPEIEKPLSKDPDKAMAQIMAAIPKHNCIVCTKPFTPALTVSGSTTERHCSPECAAESLRKKGFLPQLTDTQRAEQEANKARLTEVRKAAGARLQKARAERGPVVKEVGQVAMLTKTYGPVRKVTKILKSNAASHRALLECGHEKTIPNAKQSQAPCQKCLKETKS